MRRMERAKQDANGKARLPIEQIHCVRAGLDGGNLVICPTQLRDFLPGFGEVLPGHSLLGAQRGLGDHVLRRITRDTGEIKLFERDRIGGAEKRAYVVQAAHVFE